ncbi:MAG: vWA domain-containing protein [Promethearchaeota archaeon]
MFNNNSNNSKNQKEIIIFKKQGICSIKHILTWSILILLFYNVNYSNPIITFFGNETPIPLKNGSTYKPYASQGPENYLNASICLNQSAYLPNSYMNVTLTLTNNFSQSLSDIHFNSSINAEYKLISGSFQSDFSTLDVNESVVSSLVFKIPENASDTSSSLDVVFLIDGSGSMGEEINEVKTKVIELIEELLEKVDQVRIGFVMFGSSKYNENPYYDTRNILDLTSDADKIQDFINPFGAGGGREPWGDALHYLQEMNWQSEARLAILITDEPNNSGVYITTDTALYSLAENELRDLGIIVSTMECYGGGDPLPKELQTLANITGGIYIQLEDSASSLIEDALYLCEEAIGEYGIKFHTNFTALLEETQLEKEDFKWILIDNSPPSLNSSSTPIFVPDEGLFLYRITCSAYDSCNVEGVKLYYKFNNGIYLDTLMDPISPGIFSHLLPYLEEGTKVTYYLEASDILNNSVITEEKNFTISFSIPELSLNSFRYLTLSAGESMLLKINPTSTGNYALLIQTYDKIDVDFVSYNQSYSKELILNESVTIGMIKLLDFSSFGVMTITNTQESGLCSFQVVLTEILPYVINNPQSVIISEERPVYLYQVEIDINNNSYFHCCVNISDEYQFLKLTVFNETSSIKTHYFNVISVLATTSGKHYVMVLLDDFRPPAFEAVIDISYGDVDDVPPWKPSMAINGYPILALFTGVLFSSFIMIFLLRKKIKSKSKK